MMMCSICEFCSIVMGLLVLLVMMIFVSCSEVMRCVIFSVLLECWMMGICLVRFLVNIILF